MPIPEELIGSLWHTTNQKRYSEILLSGFIFPDPDIPDEERWSTSQGTEYYPFVRTLKGVSLFDFSTFKPNEYSKKYPASSWSEFIPYRKAWGCSIWIEIDQDTIIDNFISGITLLEKWKQENAYKNKIMPIIEAAHIGKIPSSSFMRVFHGTESGFYLAEKNA